MPSEGVDALRGLGEIWTATKEWLTAWEHYWMTADEFIEAGDRVVVLMRIHARAHAGSVLEQRIAALWTMRGDKATAVRYFMDREEALAAAGIHR
jgi:ketosteroid isomerase-like protein